MDFGTMGGKLQGGEYDTMEDVKKDLELIFANCRQFNPPLTFPITCTEIVEKVFKKEWPKAMEKKLAFNEKRGLQGVVTNLIKDNVYVFSFLMCRDYRAEILRSSWVFREPVDPVLLGIPTYFDIIPHKDARDLKTIKQKLDGDKYDSIEAFEADIELMVQNALKFNGPDSEVGVLATQLRQRFYELLNGWKSSSVKKRKDGDGHHSQPSKKVKTV
jgi:transcription initiation factor TFIID subunit 2